MGQPGGENIADANDRFAVGHRFVAHGNRMWVTDAEEYDISLGVEGRLAERLGVDARIDAYRRDNFQTGANMVHAGRIQEEISAGRYNVVDPFSREEDHLAAIEYSRLRQELDSGSESLSNPSCARGLRALRSAAATRHGRPGSNWAASKRTPSALSQQ